MTKPVPPTAAYDSATFVSTLLMRHAAAAAAIEPQQQKRLTFETNLQDGVQRLHELPARRAPGRRGREHFLQGFTRSLG